jgi:hypothetical protein
MGFIKPLKSKWHTQLTSLCSKHGKFRPNLQKLVASNPPETVTSVLTEAFAQYSKDPSDIKTATSKIAELKGIGPAAASLILSVHDPENVIFFADEAYRWLCHGGEKVAIKYNTQEFVDLFAKAKALSAKLRVTALDIERVAYVIMKESQPPKEPKLMKEPSERPAGRPRIPEDQKKPKPPPSGRGRGRPPKSDAPQAAAKSETKPDLEVETESKYKSGPNSAKRKAEADTSKSGKRAKA